MNLRLLPAALCALAVLVLPPVARADTAGRDTTFNGTGEVKLDAPTHTIRAMTLQPDGKLVLVGDTFAFGAGRIHRLNPDGSPDTGFGNRGVIHIDTPNEDHLNAVLVQPDGKIVVGGSADRAAVIYRFDERGAPDNGFGAAGRATLTTSAAKEVVQALARQADGKIVAAGQTSDGFKDAIVWRRSGVNGAPDDNFNAGGRLQIAFGVVSEEIALGVAVQANGKIVVAGNTSESTDGFVARLDATQGLDATFRGNGKFQLNHGGGEFATSVTLQRDGKILVTGATTIGQNGFIHRLLDTGQPDQGFNNSGVQFLDSAAQEAANVVLVQPDGKLVVVGSTTAGGDGGDGVFYRLTPQGAFDGSFDGDGAIGVSSGRAEALFGAALAPDGNLVGAGTSFGVGIVYRLLGDPHTLTVRRSGAGTVTAGGIACGADCSEPYDVGTRVTLTAAPGDDSRFSGWSGATCASGTAPTVCSVTMRSALTVTATFTAQPRPPQTPSGPPPATGKPSGLGGTTADTTAPRITGAALTKRRFSLGSRVTAMSAARGTGVRLTLSENAAVKLTVVGTRMSLERSRMIAGQNLVAFSGRTRRARLKPGRYRMVLTATDRAGNRSAPVRLAFTVTRGG